MIRIKVLLNTSAALVTLGAVACVSPGLRDVSDTTPETFTTESPAETLLAEGPVRFRIDDRPLPEAPDIISGFGGRAIVTEPLTAYVNSPGDSARVNSLEKEEDPEPKRPGPRSVGRVGAGGLPHPAIEIGG